MSEHCLLADVLICKRERWLTGEENDKAHSSLWTRSPGFGTRIVDKTDIKISPTSAMTS